RRFEVDVLKILGTETRRIRSLVTAEYFALGLLGGVCGSVFGVAITIFVTREVLDISTRLSGFASLGSGLLIVLLTSVIAFIASGQVVRLRATSQTVT